MLTLRDFPEVEIGETELVITGLDGSGGTPPPPPPPSPPPPSPPDVGGRKPRR